jgi:hypothetical protein
MNVLPIDLTALVAIMMGSLVILIPVAGLTIRFALKPVVDAIARTRELQGSRAVTELLEQRIALLEMQMQNVEGKTDRLLEDAEFQRQLAAGKPGL